MTYNADSPNKAWSEAVCNSIKNTLGIECIAVPTVDFATFQQEDRRQRDEGHLPRPLADGLPVDRELPGAALRQGCLASGFELGPVRATRSSTKLNAKAAAATNADEANALYQQAEALLAEDFPSAPLWYPKTTAVWSDKVTDVKVNAFGVLDFAGDQGEVNDERVKQR